MRQSAVRRDSFLGDFLNALLFSVPYREPADGKETTLETSGSSQTAGQGTTSGQEAPDANLGNGVVVVKPFAPKHRRPSVFGHDARALDMAVRTRLEPIPGGFKVQSEVVDSSHVDTAVSVVKGLNLVELSDFVKQFGEVVEGAHAAAGAFLNVFEGAHAAVGGAFVVNVGAEEEQTEFDVILEAAGAKKIAVIKEVRAMTSLGLKEAKDVVESAPKTVLQGATKEAAEKAKDALEAAGGTVNIKKR